MLLGKPLLSALDRMGCGGVILDASGDVLDLNPVAEYFLRATSRLPSDQPLPPEAARSALKALLRAGDTRFTVEGDTWVVVERQEQRPLVLHSLPLSNGTDPGPHTMVILIDLTQTPQPSSATLQKIFGLTAAEARLAVLIARGETLDQVAQACKVSMATARTQLSGVFQKTRTHRQAELVALLARVSILP